MPQAVADELGRVPMSRSLTATIARARDHAAGKGHRIVTLEHLLLALIEDEDAAAVMGACNVDLGRLAADVSNYLVRLEREPPGAPDYPPLAPELKRIVEYAAAAAQQGKRARVDGAIVLAAMIGEGQSMAAGFLRAQELTFDAVVQTLQRQAQERAAAAAQQNGAPSTSAEDILANARERIAARTAGTEGGAQPGASRPSPSPGDRAQPPPPVFAERPTEFIKRVTAASKAPATLDNAGAASTEQPETTEQAQVRMPPPLPPSQPQDQERQETAEASDGEDHSLPDWMRTRQVTLETEQPAGRPMPPPIPKDLPAQITSAQSDNVSALEPPRLRPIHPRMARADRGPAVEQGQLVENIPRRMRVGVTEFVEVRVGHGEADLAGTMPAGGAPVRHDLYITKAMSVRLRAPEGGFRIDSSSPETQWTEATLGPLTSDFAVWRFAVTPDRRGEAALQLVVAARVLARDGIMAETTLPERVITVHVRSNYVRATARAAAWLAALAIGGVVGRLGEDGLALALKVFNSLGTAG